MIGYSRVTDKLTTLGDFLQIFCYICPIDSLLPLTMILGSVGEFADFYKMHPLFGQAFDFLQRSNFSKMEPGLYVLMEGQLTATLMDVEGKQPKDAKLEAHKQFIDIQLVVKGCETMGWSPLASCTHEIAGYNAEKDISFYNDPASSYITVNPGECVIFYPNDCHAPCIGEGPIRKVVVKVLV